MKLPQSFQTTFTFKSLILTLAFMLSVTTMWSAEPVKREITDFVSIYEAVQNAAFELSLADCSQEEKLFDKYVALFAEHRRSATLMDRNISETSSHSMVMLEACAECPPISFASLQGVIGYPQVNDLSLCGVADTVALLIYNAGECDISNFVATVNFDTGLSYGGFVGERDDKPITEYDISDLSNPQFLITPIDSGEVYIMYLAIQADCDTDVSSGDPLNFDISYEFNYENATTGTTVCSDVETEIGNFNSGIKVPILNFTSISPATRTITASGANGCQSLYIRQDGLGAQLGELDFDVCGYTEDYAISIFRTRTPTVNITNYTVDAEAGTISAVLDGSHFTGPGNNDEILDVNEEIRVEICYQVQGCVDEPMFLEYKASYGCNEKICTGNGNEIDGVVRFRPNYGDDVLATSSNVSYGGICGGDVSFDLNISSENMDAIDGLWQDMIVKYVACLGNGVSISGLMVNGQPLDAGLYNTIGSTIEIDMTTNTNPAYGLVNNDGDGLFNDLPGDQEMVITTMLDISCSDSTAECDGSLSCTIDKVEVKALRNCGQGFQEFGNLAEPITFFYGQVGDPTTNASIMGNRTIPITEEFVTTADVWLPMDNGLEFGYEFDFDNIDPCTNPGETKLVITIAAAGNRIDNIRYLDGSAMYNNAGATASGDWITDPSTGDTTAYVIEVLAGDAAATLNDYYVNLEIRGDCFPDDYAYVTYKVVEECMGCGGTDPCEIIKSCGDAAFYVQWNGDDCPCRVQAYVDTLYRVNYGFADKAMTQPLTMNDVPVEDTKRFLPGDEMYVRSSYQVNDLTALTESTDRWSFRTFMNFGTGASLLMADPNNTNFLGWYWEDVSTGVITEIGIPDCMLAYPDATRADYTYPSIDLRNMGVESSNSSGDPQNAYDTCLDDPNINPNYPAESVVNYNVAYTSSGANFSDWNLYIHFDKGDLAEACGEPTNGCFDAFFLQFPIEDGDIFHVDVQATLMHSPYVELDALNNTSLASGQNVWANFIGYGTDPGSCGISQAENSCTATFPFQSHIPGPVTVSDSIVVTDCETEVFYTFGLDNPLPPLAVDELPWFAGEYRPFMATDYLQLHFPNNMIYQGDGVIVMLDGSEVPIPAANIDDEYGNLVCIDDGAGGVCCVAEDTMQLAALQINDNDFYVGRSLEYAEGVDGPNETHDPCDMPVLIHQKGDPFPHLMVGGAEQCTYGLRYNLSSLCPEEVSSNDFKLAYQFSEPYVPAMIGNVTGAPVSGHFYQSSLNQSNRPHNLFPINPYGEDCNTPTNALGCRSWFQKIGVDPILSPEAVNPLRQTGVSNSNPGKFTDMSMNFPPLLASVTEIQFLIADEADMNETNTYMVCSQDNMVDLGTHTNVATSITIPNSVNLEDVTDENGAGLTFTLVTTTAEDKTYSVSNPNLAPGECFTMLVVTELLFCPVGLDIDTEICLETTSGCINGVKAAALAAAGGNACSSVGLCYTYISEAAEIQATWLPTALPEIPLCSTIGLETQIKNVRLPNLIDIETMWWFPQGLEFVSGSWKVCYPGGDPTAIPPTNEGPCFDIPDPTGDPSQNSVYGTYFEYLDDQIWSSVHAGDPINTDGLPGVLSSLDSNLVKFQFDVETVCDEFVSGTSVWFQTDAADPCENRVESMFVQSAPIIIIGANPADYSQFFVFADPVDANCGVESEMVLTYLNTAPLGETNNSMVCMDIETSTFDYTPGSVYMVSPASYTPTFTESTNGSITHICFDIPDGIGPGQVFQTGFKFTVPEDISCGEQDLGVQVASELMSQNCMAQGIECSVGVLNSVNPVININFLPPVTVENQDLRIGCSTSDGNVEVCYDVELLNSGAFYSNDINLALFYDVDQNGQIDDYDIKLDSAMHSVLIPSGEMEMLSGCFEVPADQSCPVIFMVMQETNCVCDAQDFVYDSLLPDLGLEGETEFTVCPGDPFGLEACGDWAYTIDPAADGELVTTADSVFVTLNEGVDAVTLNVTGAAGQCDPFDYSITINSLANFTFGSTAAVEVCSATCKSLDANIPLAYQGNVTVEWFPSTYLDDPTSLTPTACNVLEDITYTIVATFTSGGMTCVFNDDVSLVVTDPMIDPLFMDTEVCYGDAASFVAPAGYAIYNWIEVLAGGSEQLVQAGSNATFEIYAPGTYKLEYFNPADVCRNYSEEFVITECPQVYDLALIKELNTVGAVSPGSDVSYTITVCNQGTIDATGIEITDYIPAGMTLSTADMNGWIGPVAGPVTNTIAALDAGDPDECTTIDILVTIDSDFVGTSLVNNAAITADDGDDVDSNPDDLDMLDDFDDDDDLTEVDGGDDEDPAIVEIACETLGGEIFYDLNNNGCQEVGEPSVTEEVIVNLYECAGGMNSGGTLVGTTTTINGEYVFGPGSPNENAEICLAPGTQYYIGFDIPNENGAPLEGYAFSTNTDVCGNAEDADDINPTSGLSGCYDPSDTDAGDGDADENIDAGIFPCVEVAGAVFYDLDNNGCQDLGETTVPEPVTVTLFECNAGANTGGTQVASTTTMGGVYSFGPESTNVNADVCLDPTKEYYVVFDVPNSTGEILEGYNFSSNDSQTCAAADQSDDVNPSTGTSGCYDPENDDATDGDADQNIDAGIYPCQDMAGQIFYDWNNNGCQETGENFVTDDVTVNLYQCNAGSNTGGTLIASTTTIGGMYEFGLSSPNVGGDVCLDPQEQYYVEFDLPNATGEDLNGFEFSTNDDFCSVSGNGDDVDPANGISGCYDPSGDDDDLHVDSGIFPCQDIGGTVFIDLNNNGCQDAGENPVSDDVTVSLYECSAGNNTGGTLVTSTTTINGDYEFGVNSPNTNADVCLEVGKEYYVVFDIPNAVGEALEDYNFSSNSDACAAADQSDDVDPSNGTSGCYDPMGDDDDLDIDAGIYPCQELGGEVFVDLNNNGCQDPGEVNTTEDVTVTLFQCDAGSNMGGTQVATTTTIGGSYEFGPDSPNTNADVCLDPAETYYVVFDIPNATGEALENYNFSSNSETCTTTDLSDNVDPSNGTSTCYDPSDDDDDDDIDAGIVPCQEMGGEVFVDLNNNGCQDVGEVNTTEDVTVTLFQCDAGSNTGGTQVATTTTIDGAYEFGPDSPNANADVCLDPSETYYVVFDIPNGDGEALEDYFLSTNSDVCAAADQSDDVDPSNGTSTCYDPSGDDDDADVDAGIVPCQEMGGEVFLDLNNNGCQDPGEVNTTEAVTVTLFQCAAGSNTGGTQVATTTTIDGSYEFGPDSPNANADVCLDPAEQYYVVFDIPNGDGEALEDFFLSTNSDACAATSDADDVDPSNGTSTCYDPNGDDDDEDVDAGIVPCQEMGGEVFVDENNNGCQDPGEVNTTEAVTVTLFQCAAGSNTGGTQVATTTTIDGAYEFGPDSPNANADVCLDPAEQYYVVFDIPNGDGEALEDYFLSTNSDVCASGDQADDVDPSNGTSTCYDPNGDDDDEDVDAGIVPCQEMGGEVFVDLNNNGCQDPGEVNTTEAVTVTLFQCAAGSNMGGTQVATTTTIDGAYEFGQDSPNANADVCLDPAEQYYVVFDIPNGDGEALEDFFLSTNSDACAATSDADDVDPSNGTSTCYDPSGDDDDADVDAGIVPCQEMGGEVFVDLNNNGCQDPGEVNTTEAVTVTLFQCAAGSNMGGTQVATTTTIDGSYEFGPDSPNANADVCLDPAEQYYVVFDIPNGDGEALEDFFLSTNSDACAATSDADDVDPSNGTSTCYDPSGDDDDADVDAGIVPCQEMGGEVFVDLNNNGCQDPGEVNTTEAVTVTLFQCAAGSNTGGTQVATTTTIDGSYEFGPDSPNANADVCLDPAEQYYVVFDIPNGDGEALEDYFLSTNSDVCASGDQADDVDPSNGTSTCYDPSGDDDDADVDAGIVPCQEMGGEVFVDLNNNGCQDPEEVNTTEAVTVTLFQCAAGSNTGGTQVATTTTINGAYEFGPDSPNANADVCLDPAEQYYVVFDIPNGDGEVLEDYFLSTNSDACAATSDADDVDPSNGTSTCYDPSGDDDDADVDVGIVPCQEMGGEVFVDLNNNGCQDVGEVNTTEAVTVTLFQCAAGSNTGGTQVATTTTISGAYEFGPDSPNAGGDVCLDPAETYYVVFDIPNGDGEALENYFLSTNSDVCTNANQSDDVDPSNGTSTCYDPSSDDDDDDVDAGIVPCQEMGGDVFVDENNNGCQDPGEINTTEDVTVTLYQCDAGSNTGGTEVATTTTINGAYEFGPDSPNADADVCLDPAETYYVVFDIPNGDGEALEDYFLSTNSDVCAAADQSDDVDPTDGTSTCYDPSGDDDDDDVDVGIVPCQEMGGDVFVDENNNGCQDPGEINTTEDVTVTLYQCDAGSNTGGTEVATTTTINGAYEFGPDSPNADADVCLDPAETYYVIFDIPNGDGEALEDYFLSTNSDVCAAADQSDDVDPTDGTSTCYDPSGDDDDDDVDVGIVPCQEMGGDVFVDENNNGCQDPGEINTTEDVTVTLYQCDAGSNTGGTEVATTTTINGAYEFGPDSPNADADVCLDPAETYYVVFDIPNADGEALEDYFLSTNSDVCAAADQSDDVDPTNGTSTCYDPSGDDDDDDVDVGIVPCQEMGGEIFNDSNGDGCQDPGETNVTEIVEVTLYQCDEGSSTGGTEVATTTTIDGSYEFGPDSPNDDADVCLDPAETYYVVFNLPNGDGEALEDHSFTTGTSVCSSSDQSDDVDPDTGGSECFDPSDDDDDDDIDAGITFYDLALTKTTDEMGPFDYGDIITFDINIYNQGGQTANLIEISDYIPCGYEYQSSNDGLWSYDANTGIATTTITSGLAPLTNTSVSIDLMLVSCTNAPENGWTNYAEISNDDGVDVDSDSDTDPDNDAGGGPDVPGEDDEINGTGNCNDCIQTVRVPLTDPANLPIVAEVYVDGAVLALPNYPYDLTNPAQALLFLTDCLALGYDVTENLAADNSYVDISVLYPGQTFDSFNINGGTSYSFTCSDCNSGGYDEDDHDPERIEIFDLALNKSIENLGPYAEGEIAEFVHTVFNQGNVPAYNVVVTDYLNEGFTFNAGGSNSPWGPAGSYVETIVPGPIAAGDSIKVSLFLEITVPAGATASSWVNEAEISSADNDTNPNNVGPVDVDSEANNDPNDDNDVQPGDDNDNEIEEHANGDDEDDNDIAYVIVVGGLGDTVWKDIDGDGIQDENEPGVQGVVVILTDCEGNFIDMELTDSEGFYFFNNLIPGDYQVQFDISGLPEGCAFTYQDQGGSDALDSDVNEFGFAPCTNIQGGEYDSTFDAGLLILASLGDYVWHDLDADGIQESGEPGIEGVTVNLYNEDGELISTTTTDENGYYLFDNLYPDTYFVEFIDPDGFDSTFSEQGNNDGLDSDITNEVIIQDGGSTTDLYILGPGENNLTIDAGYYMCVPIGETVWYDVDTDNVEDPTENGINGMKVTLWRLHNGVWTEWDDMYTGHKPGTPSDDGYYKFCAPPGTYYLHFKLPPIGLVQAQPNIGSDLLDSDVTNGNGLGTTNSFTVTSGDELCTIGAGYYPMAEVGNFVWEDSNQNGMQESNELPMEGVVVQAYDMTDNMISEVTTDDNGEYHMEYLQQQSYYLKFTPPSGYGVTVANAGDDDMDSDVTHAYGSNTTNAYALNSGVQVMNVDAGMAFGVLPVEWLYVKAENRGDHNLVEWATATEINSDYFEVERRVGNDPSYRTIEKVEAANNSLEVREYEYADSDISESGVYYYRIKQVDIDGRFDYSDIVSVTIEGSVATMNLYPNPAINATMIKVAGAEAEDAKVSVFTKDGKLIRSGLVLDEVSSGNYELRLDVSTFLPGVYTVQIETTQDTWTEKLIVIR